MTIPERLTAKGKPIKAIHIYKGARIYDRGKWRQEITRRTVHIH